MPFRPASPYITFAAIFPLSFLTRMYHKYPTPIHMERQPGARICISSPLRLGVFTSWVFLERANVAISEAVCVAVRRDVGRRKETVKGHQ